MDKTFDEWCKDNLFELSGKVYYNQNYFSNMDFRQVLKKVWDASRQNMTTRDI